MSLVENIQSLCSSKDTTLIGLERKLGLGRGTIRNWDKNSPSAEKLQKVADYFVVTTEYLLLGFERTMLMRFVNSIKARRSIEEFSEDTGIGSDELTQICLGLISEPPSLDTIDRIAKSSIDFIPLRELDLGFLLRTAGYRKEVYEESYKDERLKEIEYFALRKKEERDIARFIERILGDLEGQEPILFDGEPLDDVNKELMRINFENSMRLAKQLTKKNFTSEKR